jgi:hypothetical protein
MVIQYTNIYHSKVLQNLPKFGIFGLKTNHLATLHKPCAWVCNLVWTFFLIFGKVYKNNTFNQNISFFIIYTFIKSSEYGYGVYLGKKDLAKVGRPKDGKKKFLSGKNFAKWF